MRLKEFYAVYRCSNKKRSNYFENIFEILTAVSKNIVVVWKVTPYSLVDKYVRRADGNIQLFLGL